MVRVYSIVFVLLLFASCRSTTPVDFVFYNGSIHHYGAEAATYSGLVIHEGKVVAVGNGDSLLQAYEAKEKIDLQGGHLYPGWHDAHAHFTGYARGLQELDFRGDTSWTQCMGKISAFIEANPKNAWIRGRGWDQNLWGGEYPDRSLLDSLFPNYFFYLSRVDGHAALVSGNVLEKLNMDTSTQIQGGLLLRDASGNNLNGILIDLATDMAAAQVPDLSDDEWETALLEAQSSCLAQGITAITEAGISLSMMQRIHKLQEQGKLQLKFIVMFSPGEEEFKFAEENGIFETANLKVSSFKLYADGALGSRGAWLKKPYCDHSGQGLMLEDTAYFDSVCARIYQLGYQANTHCIGDAANGFILSTYAKYLGGVNDKRWRIEHAQVVDSQDFHFFKAYSIVPSVQPTHATSDMPWAEKRLCTDRMSGAYAYRSLLNVAGVLPLGTDFPVERIDPLHTVLAAVYRKNLELSPDHGFRTEEAISMVDCLRGMTWWPAWAGFKETQWGSLEPGKVADFVWYGEAIESAKPEDLVGMKPLQTWINGKQVCVLP
ncbi:MAG: amidohydrolase [Bacteroidota bacterium]|nr:amidohydrolase [Bacteroidota bacterium]MDX5430041.1 amidohydrolase [Bacteroidota bacterium]MDX5468811.1 amidohydrolase [Bacteroidota bacterium]